MPTLPKRQLKDLGKWTKMLFDKILVAAEGYRVNIDSLLKEKNKGNRCYHNGKGMRECKAPRAEDIITFRRIGTFHEYIGAMDFKKRPGGLDGV